MVLEWLSSLFDRLSFQLGRSSSRSIWNRGRDSLSENIFQTAQLYKFTPAYTHDLNLQNIKTKMGMLENFTHAEKVVQRINQQTQINLGYLDTQIQTLENIEKPNPLSFNYQYPTFSEQQKEFSQYQTQFTSSINKQIEFLSGKRDLITSRSFSL